MIEALAKLVKCENLTEEEAASAFEVIMRGDATPSQIAGFVGAPRIKGETGPAGAAGVEKRPPHLNSRRHRPRRLRDTCDLLDGLALDAKRNDKAGDLGRRGVASHDHLERGCGFLLSEVLALDELRQGVNHPHPLIPFHEWGGSDCHILMRAPAPPDGQSCPGFFCLPWSTPTRDGTARRRSGASRDAIP